MVFVLFAAREKSFHQPEGQREEKVPEFSVKRELNPLTNIFYFMSWGLFGFFFPPSETFFFSSVVPITASVNTVKRYVSMHANTKKPNGSNDMNVNGVRTKREQKEKLGVGVS